MEKLYPQELMTCWVWWRGEQRDVRVVLGVGGSCGAGTGLRWGRTVCDECEVPAGQGTAPAGVQVWESAHRKVRKG